MGIYSIFNGVIRQILYVIIWELLDYIDLQLVKCNMYWSAEYL